MFGDYEVDAGQDFEDGNLLEGEERRRALEMAGLKESRKSESLNTSEDVDGKSSQGKLTTDSPLPVIKVSGEADGNQENVDSQDGISRLDAELSGDGDSTGECLKELGDLYFEFCTPKK